MKKLGFLAVGLAFAGCSQQPAPVLSGYSGQVEQEPVKHYTLRAAQGPVQKTVVSQRDTTILSSTPAMQEESLALIEPAAGESYVNTDLKQEGTYVFQEKDTLYSVAREHNTTARKLIEVNGLASAADVQPGQRLVIPAQDMAGQPSAVGAVAMAEKANSRVQSQVIEAEKKIQSIEPAAGELPSTGLQGGQGASHAQKIIQNSDLKDYSASGGKVVEQNGVRYAEHLVAAGETVYRISLNYKASVFDVMAANDFVTPQDLKAGTLVRVPLPQAETVQQAGLTGTDKVQQGVLNEQLSADKGLNKAYVSTLTPARTVETPVVAQMPAQTIDRSNAPSDEPELSDTSTAGGTTTTFEQKTVTVEQGTIGTADREAMEKVVTTTKTTTKVSADNTEAIMLVQKGHIDPLAAKAKGLAWPVKGKIIRKYGEAAEGVNHTGINIAVPMNTPVVAAETGTVLYADSGLKTYGNLVLIRHPDGMVTAYAHNNKLLVSKGEKVKKGQVVALSGSSGNVDSPQVHFEIRKEARAIDPLRVLASR